MVNLKGCLVKNPEHIVTPKLLVFESQVDKNIETILTLTQQINLEFKIKNVCPHVKTHKSSWVTKKLLDRGFEYFKATPNEVEMLITSGVKRIFVAYPLTFQTAEWLARIIVNNTQVNISVQIGRIEHAEIF